MTKMAAMPIYGKNLLGGPRLGGPLLRNRWTDFEETWHEALMTQVLQCMYKSNHDPVMTLTYFKARSTWVAYEFEWVNC